MAKSTSIEQYVAILKTIQRFATGGSLKDIGAALTPPMLERDLRDCVNALINEGRVIRDGSCKLSTYRLAPGGLSGLEAAPTQPPARAESVAFAAKSGVSVAESAAANVPVANRGYNALPNRSAADAGDATPSSRSVVQANATGSSRPQNTTRQAPPPPPTPPTPEPEPPARIVTDEERAKFKEYLDQMVPAIVRTEMKRHDAQFYASEAAEGLPSGDDDWFKEVIEAELDGLDPAGAAAYGIAPAAFKKWRARW